MADGAVAKPVGPEAVATARRLRLTGPVFEALDSVVADVPSDQLRVVVKFWEDWRRTLEALVVEREQKEDNLLESAPVRLRARMRRPGGRRADLSAVAETPEEFEWVGRWQQLQMVYERLIAVAMRLRGLEEYAARVEKRYAARSLDARRIARKLDACRRPSGPPSSNAIGLRLRLLLVRQYSRRGPPKDDDDDEDPALISLIRRGLSWLTSGREVDRVGR